VLVGAVLCLGATFLVLSTMQSLPAFYAATMLLALGNAGIGDVSVGAVVTRWFQRSRGIALGFAFAGSNIGAVVFVHAIDEWTGLFGWRAATAAVGVAGMALILPFALFVVRDPGAGEGEDAFEAATASGTGLALRGVTGRPVVVAEGRADAAGTAGGPESEDDSSSTLKQAIRRAPFWVLFFTVFCYAVAQLGMIDHLVLYLVDLGYERSEAADALGLTVGAGILAKLGAGAVALRIPTRRLLVANTALLALAVGLLPFAADPRILVAAGIAFGIATSARDVLIPLSAAEFFGARYFAEIYGVMMLAYFPGGGLGPLVLARVRDVTGGYEPGFAICLAILLAALAGQIFAARQAFGRPAARAAAIGSAQGGGGN
jgi:sugar phosphate permease